MFFLLFKWCFSATYVLEVFFQSICQNEFRAQKTLNSVSALVYLGRQRLRPQTNLTALCEFVRNDATRIEIGAAQSAAFRKMCFVHVFICTTSGTHGNFGFMRVLEERCQRFLFGSPDLL